MKYLLHKYTCLSALWIATQTIQAGVLTDMAQDFVPGDRRGSTVEEAAKAASTKLWLYYSSSNLDPQTWKLEPLKWGRVSGAGRDEPGYVAAPISMADGLSQDLIGISNNPLFRGSGAVPDGYLYWHSSKKPDQGLVAEWRVPGLDEGRSRLIVDLEIQKVKEDSTVEFTLYHNEEKVLETGPISPLEPRRFSVLIADCKEGDRLLLVMDSAGSALHDATYVSAVVSDAPSSPEFAKKISLKGEVGRRRALQKEAIWDYQTGKLHADRTYLDFNDDLIQPYLERVPVPEIGRHVLLAYSGAGKGLEAAVDYAYLDDDPKLASETEAFLDALINSADPNGYIGMALPRNDDRWYFGGWIYHDGAYIVLALVEDYMRNGDTQSLEAARAFADFMRERWRTDVRTSPIGITEALYALYLATGERAYLLDFADIPYDGRWIQQESVRNWREYLIPMDLERKPFDIHKIHTYRLYGRCLEQLHLARETEDPGLYVMSDYVIDKLVDERAPGLFISGASGRKEGWVEDQDGRGGIGEGCAVVHLFWLLDELSSQRDDLAYGDIMERILLNHMMAAQNAEDGRTRYFVCLSGERSYHKGAHCCDGNIRRFWARLPEQTYQVSEDRIAVNLYIPSSLEVETEDGAGIRIEQRTDYPADDTITLAIDPSPPAALTLDLRIPQWAKSDYTVRLNGKALPRQDHTDRFSLKRTWQPGDIVELEMPMKWRWVKGTGFYAGRAALMRGPQVFSLSRELNPGLAGVDLMQLTLNPTTVEAVEPPPSTEARNGQAATVMARLSDGSEIPLILTDFPEESSVETYFKINDPSIAGQDELYRQVDLSGLVEAISRQEGEPHPDVFH